MGAAAALWALALRALLLQGTACLPGAFALPLPLKEMRFSESSTWLQVLLSVNTQDRRGKTGFFFTQHVSLVEPLKEKFTCQTHFIFLPGIILGTGRKIHCNLYNWTGLVIQMRFPYLAASLQKDPPFCRSGSERDQDQAYFRASDFANCGWGKFCVWCPFALLLNGNHLTKSQ